ncbi:hypothetical protein FLAV_02546 [Flavobacteriales bacterium]|mgnify:CR=1 FL=1|nr:hypothetical protein FLAV_02546 [Flavobacteriales bacterium]
MESSNDQPLDWLHAFTNSSLHLILFMTEQCNFRCVYCYEDFKLNNIQDEVVVGVKNLILKRIPEIKHLAISYFGGEPLLNKKGVLDLTTWAKELCEEHGVKYHGNITTNGYTLDKKTFDSIFQKGITNYQITIDGNKDSHDKLRPTINGKSTFDKIIGNIKMMKKSPYNFECIIRLNVSDSNFEGVKSFIKNEAYAICLNDSRFKIHFHPIWGRPELILTQKNQLEELNVMVDSFGLTHTEESGLTDLNNNNKEKIDNSATKKGREADYVCYASKANSFVIRADGTLQKCTVALKDDINNIGKLNSDGTMELDSDKLSKWIFSKDKGCPLQALALEKLAVPYKDAGKFDNPISL